MWTKNEFDEFKNNSKLYEIACTSPSEVESVHNSFDRLYITNFKAEEKKNALIVGVRDADVDRIVTSLAFSAVHKP